MKAEARHCWSGQLGDALCCLEAGWVCVEGEGDGGSDGPQRLEVLWGEGGAAGGDGVGDPGLVGGDGVGVALDDDGLAGPAMTGVARWSP